MKKGCTALQNIQLLRWCKELGIKVAWNILGGIPRAGGRPKLMNRWLRWYPFSTHLPEPGSCSAIRLDRFSPLFTECGRLGLCRVRPKPGYYYIFPFGRLELERIAYFFDLCDYADGRHPDDYTAPPRSRRQLVVAGGAATRRPGSRVSTRRGSRPDEVEIEDSRDCAAERAVRYDGLPARILASPAIRRAASRGIASHVGSRGNRTDNPVLPARSDRLSPCRRRSRGLYLTLAVMRNRSVMFGGCVQNDHIPTNAPAHSELLLHSL